MENHRIILDNQETVLPTIATGSIDLIYTDPPFGMNYLSNIPGSKQWNKSQKSTKFSSTLMNDSPDDIDWESFAVEAYRILRQDSFLVMHCNIPMLAKVLPILVSKGLVYKGTIAWYKAFAIGGDLKASLKRDWEPILYMTKGKPSTNPIQVSREGSLQERKRISEIVDWNFSLKKEDKTGHPTEKPNALAKQVIELFSNPGDLILDPFAGTCRFGRIAIENNRKAISVEIDKTWIHPL